MVRDEHELLAGVQEDKEAFGVKCNKLTGAVTVELLRSALLDLGVAVSPRDVFIRGVPIEVDLLLPTRDGILSHGLVYEPEDVLAAFEVKYTGSFGEKALTNIRRSFTRIRAANPRIHCAYVTLAERKRYKWAATADNLGADAFTLFWHNGSSIARRYDPTGDWSRLVDKLKSLGQG